MQVEESGIGVRRLGRNTGRFRRRIRVSNASAARTAVECGTGRRRARPGSHASPTPARNDPVPDPDRRCRRGAGLNTSPRNSASPSPLCRAAGSASVGPSPRKAGMSGACTPPTTGRWSTNERWPRSSSRYWSAIVPGPGGSGSTSPTRRSFDAEAIAARIGNRALLTRHRIATDQGLHDLLLHPEVSAQLLAAISPLFLAAPDDRDPLPRLLGPDGLLSAYALTLVDDRSDPTAPVVGPCDGEGLPARRTLLLEEGAPRHRVASFADARRFDETPRGGAVRFSYRDRPATGLANLRVRHRRRHGRGQAPHRQRPGPLPAAPPGAGQRAISATTPTASSPRGSGSSTSG